MKKKVKIFYSGKQSLYKINCFHAHVTLGSMQFCLISNIITVMMYQATLVICVSQYDKQEAVTVPLIADKHVLNQHY